MHAGALQRHWLGRLPPNHKMPFVLAPVTQRDQALFFPKYGIWSQTSPRRDTHSVAGGNNTATIPFISHHHSTKKEKTDPIGII